SCARATPPTPARTNRAPKTSVTRDDLTVPSRSRLLVAAKLSAQPADATADLIFSPLRDRRFDVSLEARALAQSIVPRSQIVERRALYRKGEPAIDLGAEHDLGEAQLGAGKIRLALDLIVDDRPGRQRPAPRGVDRGRIARLGLGANK